VVLYDNDCKRDAPMVNQGSLKAAHTDLQVINAPKLALSQSLGLQAKDWGYPLREARGYYRSAPRRYWAFVQSRLSV
jgi:hypothetical protein